jgi:hypothetical protein
MRKISRKGLKRKADKLFSEQVRCVGKCELKGLDSIRCGGSLQCMHIDTRGKHAIRWKFQNAICGCAGHHIYYTYHENDWMKLIKKHFPEKYKFVEEHQSAIWDKNIDRVLEELTDGFEVHDLSVANEGGELYD